MSPTGSRPEDITAVGIMDFMYKSAKLSMTRTIESFSNSLVSFYSCKDR